MKNQKQKYFQNKKQFFSIWWYFFVVYLVFVNEYVFFLKFIIVIKIANKQLFLRKQKKTNNLQ